jgi:DNA-binding transcriptional ArsR family regulator
MMNAAVQAIAEPRRREILRLIRDSEMSAGEIAARFDVTRPAISQHLSILRAAGLLHERRQGTRRLYRARPQGLVELRAWLEAFWEDNLARLKVEAESIEARRTSRSQTGGRHGRRTK